MEPKNSSNLWDEIMNDVLLKSVLERGKDFFYVAVDVRNYIATTGIKDKNVDCYTKDECIRQWNIIKPNEEDKESSENSFIGKPIQNSTKHKEKKPAPSIEKKKNTTDSKVTNMLSFLMQQQKAFEDSREGDELIEYRYIRSPTGEIIVMSKPYSKLTPQELKDTEQGMTEKPFDEKDPDVRIKKIKQPERAPSVTETEKCIF